MPEFLKMFSKYKAPALLIALALCFFTFYEFSSHDHDHSHDHEDHHIGNAGTVTKVPTPKKGNDHKHDHGNHPNHEDENISNLAKEQKEKLKALSQFSFQKEQEAVNKKLDNYEANKEELITIILAADPYKGLPTPPHTIHSIVKNQRGAFKVWTLKKVAAKERQSTSFFERILNEAQDDTLRKIAKAALNLIEQGSTDPIKDIASGLGNLDAIHAN